MRRWIAAVAAVLTLSAAVPAAAAAAPAAAAAAPAAAAAAVPAAAAAAAPARARTAAGSRATVTAQGRDLVQEPVSIALGVDLPIFEVYSERFVPPGFAIDAAQAIAASEHNREMLSIHARQHPLHVLPLLWLGREWLVDFYYHGHLVAQTNVSRSGHLTHVWTGPVARAEYAQGDFAVPFGRWWVLVPFSLLFLLPFLDPRRPLRATHLDALALLSFLASYLLFDHTELVAGVWAMYPPLLYLLARMLWIGAHRARPRPLTGRTAAPLLSTPSLAIGLGVIVAARVVLSLLDSTVADVGYASVIGAHQIATGGSLYMQTAAHGDTYGPVAYLAYLPFELLFPWHGAWDYLPSAHAASLFFDLVTIAGLVALGRRLRHGRGGLRLGLALGWAWAACPFTLLALMMHTNDGLIAMLSVLSLLAFASPGGRGAVLGLAAAAKFAPASLLGLYAGGQRWGLRRALECAGAFTLVLVASIVPYLPRGGLSGFYEQTIGFQLGRSDVFSLWALHPDLAPLKIAVEVAVVGLAAALLLRPQRRSLVQVCALAAATTIAVQVPAVHWFYYYIDWFAPFVLVALLAAAPTPAIDGVRTTRPVAASDTSGREMATA
jgi:hypothetical protein